MIKRIFKLIKRSHIIKHKNNNKRQVSLIKINKTMIINGKKY